MTPKVYRKMQNTFYFMDYLFNILQLLEPKVQVGMAFQMIKM